MRARDKPSSIATRRQTEITYDNRGNVTSSTDGLGNTTTLTYDRRGNTLSITDPLGNATVRIYDGRNNITSRVDPHAPGDDPADHTTTFAYNDRGDQTSLTLPSGGTVFRDYDDHGNLTAIRDDQGNTLYAATYSDSGNLLSETDRGGTTSFAYDANGINQIGETDPDGETSSLRYNDSRQLIGLDDAEKSMNFAFDELGRETVSNYDGGVASRLSYDVGAPDWTRFETLTGGGVDRSFTKTGRLGGYAHEDGNSIEFAYDGAGRFRSQTDNQGFTLSNTYDGAGQLESSTDGSTGATTTYERDNAGRTTATIDALGNRTELTYEPDGTVASATDARGHAVTFDETPTTASITDGLGRTTVATRTPLGLPIETLHPDGTTTSSTFLGATLLDEAEERPMTFTDELGRVRTFGYDDEGELTSATDLGGNIWTYVGTESTQATTSPSGETLTVAYDDSLNPFRVDYPGGGTEEMSYEQFVLLSTRTRPDGTVINYAYDNVDRLTSRTSSDGDIDTTTYDTFGRVETVNDASGTAAMSYDTAGRFAGFENGSGASIEYERDVLGRVIAVRTQASAAAQVEETRYVYDEVGSISQITDPLGGETSMVYDLVGRLERRTLPNGVVTEFTYDLRDRISSIVHRRNQTVLASFAYERSLSGEPTRITREDGRAVALSYTSSLAVETERRLDPLGTLIRETTYAYDIDGNRVGVITTEGQSTYSYAPGFRLASVTTPQGPESYTTDVAGRITDIDRDGVQTTLTYTSTDRTRSVTVNGQVTNYTHDAAGRRVGVVDAAGTRSLLVAPSLGGGLDSPHLIVDQSTGTPLAGYVYRGEHALMRYDSGGVTYYLEDAMGSVIGTTDSSGALAQRFHYDSFGQSLNATGTPTATTVPNRHRRRTALPRHVGRPNRPLPRPRPNLRSQNRPLPIPRPRRRPKPPTPILAPLPIRLQQPVRLSRPERADHHESRRPFGDPSN